MHFSILMLDNMSQAAVVSKCISYKVLYRIAERDAMQLISFKPGRSRAQTHDSIRPKRSEQ